MNSDYIFPDIIPEEKKPLEHPTTKRMIPVIVSGIGFAIVIARKF